MECGDASGKPGGVIMSRIRYLSYSTVTPRNVYFTRRRFFATALAAGAASRVVAAKLDFVKSPLN